MTLFQVLEETWLLDARWYKNSNFFPIHVLKLIIWFLIPFFYILHPSFHQFPSIPVADESPSLKLVSRISPCGSHVSSLEASEHLPSIDPIYYSVYSVIRHQLVHVHEIHASSCTNRSIHINQSVRINPALDPSSSQNVGAGIIIRTDKTEKIDVVSQ